MEESFSKLRKHTDHSNPQNPQNSVSPLDLRLKKGEKQLISELK